jgi:hypothetical protein
MIIAILNHINSPTKYVLDKKNLFQITGQLIKLKFATYKSSLFYQIYDHAKPPETSLATSLILRIYNKFSFYFVCIISQLHRASSITRKHQGASIQAWLHLRWPYVPAFQASYFCYNPCITVYILVGTWSLVSLGIAPLHCPSFCLVENLISMHYHIYCKGPIILAFQFFTLYFTL